MTKDLIPQHAIPTQWATYLCDEVAHNNENQWLSLAKVLCWRCHFFAHGDDAKRCFCRTTDNTGCPVINARDRHYYWAFHNN
ncbi:MAG: hypothetical protein WCF84_27020 [Anaerolineae bacterium]